MKGIDINKYKFHLGIKNNELNLNEIKVAELKLNLNQCFLPLIDNHKEKRVSINSSDSNNFSTSENKFDSLDFQRGKDLIKKKPDELNRIKPRYPILWLTNQSKKVFTEANNIQIDFRNKTSEKSTDIHNEAIKTTRKEKITPIEEKIRPSNKIEESKEFSKKHNDTAKLINTEEDSIKELIFTKIKEVEKINWIRGDLIEENIDFIIHFAFNLDNGSRFLVKRFNDEKLLGNELDVIKSLNHKNILKHLYSENLYIYYEYPSNGTLKNFIKNFGSLNEKIIKKITIQIVNSIIFLNSEGITHQNLNSSNIFMEYDGCIKISNFLYAKRNLENETNKQQNFENLLKLDILSVALIIIEMSTGIISILKNDLEEIHSFINQSCADNIREIPINIKNFLKSFNDVCDNEKTNINLIINHPFLL